MNQVFLFLFLISALSFSILMICSGFESNPFCAFITENHVYFGAGSIHLGLFSAAMFFLWKKDLGTTLKQLALPGDIKKNLLYSVAGFIAVIAVLMVLSIVANLAGFNDQQAIYEKVAELPIYILAFAVIAAPISEELFFRAFLVPRVGVVLSSVFFGLLHFSYGSIVEMVGAALIGIVLAVILKRSKSITPCLVIHVAYNLLSVIVMKVLM